MASSHEYSPANTVGIDQAVKENGNTINAGNPLAAATPPEFVLIHGIGSGAWCWYKVKCFLENTCGYKVTCLDLTGAGKDQTDPGTVLTFPHYNKPLIDFLSSVPDNQQVILVGHSAGGLSLSDAINKFGCKKIKVAVFVAATMLKSGFATEDDLRIGVPEKYVSEQETEAVTQLKMAQQLCPLEDYTLIKLLERPGPLKAITSAKFKEGEDADKVPRIFIKTTYDNVVKAWQQEAMIKKWPPSDVYVVDSDHLPVFSAPVQLTGLLHKAALTYGYN